MAISASKSIIVSDVAVVVFTDVTHPSGRSSRTESLYEVRSLPVFSNNNGIEVISPSGTSNGPWPTMSAPFMDGTVIVMLRSTDGVTRFGINGGLGMDATTGIVIVPARG